jgi:hypothetical protein
MSAMVRTLTPDRSARSSWVSPAAIRRPRSHSPGGSLTPAVFMTIRLPVISRLRPA